MSAPTERDKAVATDLLLHTPEGDYPATIAAYREEIAGPLVDALKVAQAFVAAFAGYYQEAYQTGPHIHVKHQQALDQVAKALKAYKEAAR